MSDKDLISDAKEAFKLAADHENDNRVMGLADLKFARMAEQWPDDVKKQREKEGRPCLTINRLPSFIRQVVNDARQNKPSIKVHPVDSVADPETAEIISGLIRNIEQTSGASASYDTALECAASNGFGYFRINTRQSFDDSFDLDLCIQRVNNPFSVYGDPNSQAVDSSDWNSAFVTEVLSREQFRAKYKGAEEVNWESAGYGAPVDPWITEDAIMVAEYWRRDQITATALILSDGTTVREDIYAQRKDMFDAKGVQVIGSRPFKTHKVSQCVLTGAEKLSDSEWAGKYIPIVPVYGEEVNVEGKRYFRSLIHDAVDAQRMFNYWRTMATELVALAPKAPWVGPQGAFSVDRGWDTANTESHPYLEYKGSVAPQRQPFAGVPAGALQEALNASDDMKSIMGLFDASLGAKSNETSGRAIMARQREGDISTFHFIDNLSRALEHGGRILIDMIPHVYSGARILRVLGPEGEATNVKMGEPVQVAGKDGQITTRIYDLSAGKYDLTVTTGPSFTSRREEAAMQMTDLIRSFPQAAPVIGDLLAKNLDWPGADEIAKRLQTLLPPQLQGGQGGQNPQMEQMGQALQQMQGKLQQAQAELQANAQDNALKARELEIKQFEAETKRVEAEADLIRAKTEATRPTPVPQSPAPVN